MRILALTVGGSCAPVVASLRDHTPDYVCFFASTGPKGSIEQVHGQGKPCGRNDDKRPNIVTQAGLSREMYEVTPVENPDALSDLYDLMLNRLREIESCYGSAEYIADYTGGTKSMGAALVLAALHLGWKISLVTGQRTNLVQVVPGTEIAEVVNVTVVRARQQVERARGLFNRYAFKSAEELLSTLLQSGIPDPDLRNQIRQYIVLCRGFDAWDKFDHSTAAHLLETIQSQIVPYWMFLKKLAGRAKATGYEPVLDLVRNAERRAARGRFDDAVARLYRAIEMLAQTRLRQREPALDSSNLDLERLPDTLRPRYERIREINEMRGWKPEVKLGLMEDYILLADLDDPLGKIFVPIKGQLREAIKKRNHSILAHGGTPLGERDYREMHSIASTLIHKGLEALKVTVAAPQFPRLEIDGIHQREED